MLYQLSYTPVSAVHLKLDGGEGKTILESAQFVRCNPNLQGVSPVC
jgi:hypothetical protein